MKNNSLLHHWFFALFILSYFCLISFLAISKPTPFFDWDEAIYAQVGKEMIREKSFFVPLWQGKAWLDKPPLPSLVYGLVQLIPASPEITTRLMTLLLSSFILVLIYYFVFYHTKQILPSILTTVITAFLPVFFQRTQALNVDVFLLMGWVGYALWYDKFWISTVFLLIAVLSKSLLGLYPIGLVCVYQTFRMYTKQINQKKYIAFLKLLFLQCCIASIWFIAMYLYYGQNFIQLHFIESHFKRVTASIEQHFGQRTFYVDILIEQFKWLIIPAAISGLVILFQGLKKNTDIKKNFFLVFFVPWFIFLNLTKTKIAWYIYPVLPQFALLSSYPLVLMKSKLYSIIYFAMALTFLFIFINPIPVLVSNSFSQMEDHHRIAIEAKNNICKYLYVLVGENTRTSYATLKSMGLVITTTTWWGNHPSIAYYSQAKTDYIYNINFALKQYMQLNRQSCLIIERADHASFPSVNGIRKISSVNPTYLLFKGK